MPKTKNLSKFTDLAIKDLQYSEEIASWTPKQLADYLIMEVWGDSKNVKFGTLKCAALDRTIQELFKLDDIEKMNKLLKPDKNAKVPKYDILTEGYDLNKLKP